MVTGQTPDHLASAVERVSGCFNVPANILYRFTSILLSTILFSQSGFFYILFLLILRLPSQKRKGHVGKGVGLGQHGDGSLCQDLIFDELGHLGGDIDIGHL
jgi:hypothetical protein